MSELTIDKLNKLYQDAENQDRELFAEQRSNILLVSGEHYTKINSRVQTQVRQSNQSRPAGEQKLRLTQNLTHKVAKDYVTAILADAPGTTVAPKNESEIQDQKDAELNLAVWLDFKKRKKYTSKIRDWAQSYVRIGEVATKLTWSWDIGEFQGYEPKLGEDGQPEMEAAKGEDGEPQMEPVSDEQGQPVQDPMTGAPMMQPTMVPVPDKTKPIFSGDYLIEDIYGFNLLRESGTQDADDPDRAWIIRKMVNTDELKYKYRNDEGKAKKIMDGARETYIVFDADKATYSKQEGQTLVREYYWRPCTKYPEGYFVITTKEVILEQGSLPGGLFPIVFKPFDKYETSSRGRSIIKFYRPYQAEINRSSSMTAVHQVTLGDDKVLYQSGTKLTQGALLPGVRGIAYQGQPPTILAGRSGAQYMDYTEAKKAEGFLAVDLDSQQIEDKGGQVEPYALLFRSAAKKRKFSIYAAGFMEFLVEFNELVLKTAKHFLPDDMLIGAIGRREQVNIPEFRKTTPLAYQITVEESNDTLETQFGKQMTLERVLQYAGQNLDKKTLGKLLKNMPFGNSKEIFDDLTIEEDLVQNDMLALERGEQVAPTPYVDDPEWTVKKLTGRMKQPDFRYLAPEIQQGYQKLVQDYQNIIAEQEAKLAAAKNEYIPVDGALVTVDMYVEDPEHPENQAKRLKLPQRTLEWVMKRMDEQGASQAKLEGMNAQALSEIAEKMMAQKQQAPGMQGGQGQPPGMPGAING